MVQWPEKSDKKKNSGDNEPLVLSGSEEYFSTKFYLLGSQSSTFVILTIERLRIAKFQFNHYGTGSPLILPAGSLNYPFNINLPMNLPNSFEHEFGFVRYTVTAIFNGTHTVEHEVTATFNVSSTYDLNERPEAAVSRQRKF